MNGRPAAAPALNTLKSTPGSCRLLAYCLPAAVLRAAATRVQRGVSVSTADRVFTATTHLASQVVVGNQQNENVTGPDVASPFFDFIRATPTFDCGEHMGM